MIFFSISEGFMKIYNIKILNFAFSKCKNQEEAHTSVSYLLDLFGKLCGLLSITGNFYKSLSNFYQDDSVALEKVDDMNYYLKQWTLFCDRNHNCRNYKYPTNLIPESFTSLEISHIVWPLLVRTSVYCATQFIKVILY